MILPKRGETPAAEETLVDICSTPGYKNVKLTRDANGVLPVGIQQLPLDTSGITVTCRNLGVFNDGPLPNVNLVASKEQWEQLKDRLVEEDLREVYQELAQGGAGGLVFEIKKEAVEVEVIGVPKQDVKGMELVVPVTPSIRKPEDSDITVATVTFGGLHSSVGLKKLSVLAPRKYLNDDLLDFGIADACLRDGINPKEVIFLSSLVFQLMFKSLQKPLPENGVQRLLSMLMRPKANLLGVKYIGLPVCREKHWFLIIICNPFPDQCIIDEANKMFPNPKTEEEIRTYWNHVYMSWLSGVTPGSFGKPAVLLFDSSVRKGLKDLKNYPFFLDNTMKYVKRALISIHEKYWRDLRRPKFTIKFEEICPLFDQIVMDKIPQQPNSYDCGFFLIEYAAMWLRAARAHNDNYNHLIYNYDFSKDADQNEVCAMRWTIRERIIAICKEQKPEHLGTLHATLEKINTMTSLKDEDEEPEWKGEEANNTYLELPMLSSLSLEDRKGVEERLGRSLSGNFGKVEVFRGNEKQVEASGGGKFPVNCKMEVD